ncbi:MAG: hypothetical protein PHI50_01710 [Alphaproteobacteria bacterium]|nr:hypothetical protein [Alphaproteobacteria bacterium]
MKKIKTTLFLLLTLLFSTQGMAREVCSGINMAFLPEYPPFMWTEKIEYKTTIGTTILYERKGVVKEILKSVFKQKEGKGEIGQTSYSFSKYLPLIELEENLFEGNIDFVPLIPFKSELRQGVEFIYPAYFLNPYIFISLKENFISNERVKKESLLGGVALQDEEFIENIRSDLSYLNLKTYKDEKELFQDLLDKKIDYIFSGFYFAKAEIARFALEKRVKIEENPLVFQSLFFAFSKKKTCPEEAEKLKQFALEMQKDSTFLKEEIEKSLQNYSNLFKQDPPLLPSREKE